MDFWQAGIDLEEIRSGKKTAIAGALNLLENRKPDESGLAAELIEALTRTARPRRHVIGITGPPGAGKTMLARRLPGILPPLSIDEAIAVTRIHSVAGLLDAGCPLVARRPFRAPHHTVSAAGLVGGGRLPRPGEVSLAHASSRINSHA